MKYRKIIYTEDLPEHLNLLRNMQDAHARLSQLSDDFPIIDLMDTVRNYEFMANMYQVSGLKILSKKDPDSKAEWAKFSLQISSTLSTDILKEKKETIINFLENLITVWQDIVDKVEWRECP